MKSKRGGYNKRDWSEAERIISENTHMARKPLAALCRCHCQTKSFTDLCDKYGINVHKKYKQVHPVRESSLPSVDYRAELETTLRAIMERTGITDFKGREGRRLLNQYERELQGEQAWRCY